MRPTPPPSPIERKRETVRTFIRGAGIDDAEVEFVESDMVNFTAPGRNPWLMRGEDFRAIEPPMRIAQMAIEQLNKNPVEWLP